MSDDHIKSDIPAYLSGGLPEHHRRQIDAHVAGCDACRQALTKARAKQARARRQALKSAVPDPMPNLFLNRLSKQAGSDRSSRRGLWLWVGVVLVAGGVAAILMRADFKLPRTLPVKTSEPEPAGSSGVKISTEAQVAAPSAAGAVPAQVTESSGSAVPPDEDQKPRAWSGSDSGVKDFREVIVRGRSAWRSLWEEMGQTSPAPRINFYDVCIVGVFAGEKAGPGFNVELAEPQNESESTLLAYRITAPPAGSAATPLTHPYALKTIPRGTKPIRFLEETAANTAAVKEKTP